jgi:hypothetical protein
MTKTLMVLLVVPPPGAKDALAARSNLLQICRWVKRSKMQLGRV